MRCEENEESDEFRSKQLVVKPFTEIWKETCKRRSLGRQIRPSVLDMLRCFLGVHEKMKETIN